jgi:hypothetical protein
MYLAVVTVVVVAVVNVDSAVNVNRTLYIVTVMTILDSTSSRFLPGSSYS